MRPAAAALVALAATLLLVAPAAAAAATREELQDAAFAVSAPSPPLRDLVIEHTSRTQARAIASASTARFDVHDGAGRSVDISESTLCLATCDTTAQQIADLLGQLPHGSEMNLLSVLMVKPAEMGSPTACGSAGALSCYFPDQNRMVISGDDITASDNATRDYVVAHEYGHHLANHRNNAPFANPAVDWGPKRWASFAGVCKGVGEGRYVPGDEDQRYYDNPGEAFAESFAKYAFPTLPVPWEWPDFPDPHTAGGFAAIQRDAVDPWKGPGAERRRGHFPARRRPHKRLKRFSTPNDGDFTVKLNGTRRANFDLRLRGPDNTVIGDSDGPGSKERISFRICGERHFTAIVKRHGRHRARFKLFGLAP